MKWSLIILYVKTQSPVSSWCIETEGLFESNKITLKSFWNLAPVPSAGCSEERPDDSLPKTPAASAGRCTGAAGERNLPLVLSNLHFPWCLREVDVSSCFLSKRGTYCPLHPFIFDLGRGNVFFFLSCLLLYWPWEYLRQWNSKTLQSLRGHWHGRLDFLPSHLHTLDC